MQATKAIKLTAYLMRRWGISPAFDMAAIIGLLQSGVLKKYSRQSEFEFSLTDSEKSIRLLHLSFFNTKIKYQRLAAIEVRIKTILAIANLVAGRLGPRYDLGKLKDILSLAREIPCPLQFGMAVNPGNIIVLKIYFSVLNESRQAKLILNRLYPILGLKRKKIEKIIRGRLLDAIGVDILPTGGYNLKAYALCAMPFEYSGVKPDYSRYLKGMHPRHIGFLYRINVKSGLSSVKLWVRFRKPVTVKALAALENVILCRFIDTAGKIINHVDGRISYVTLEGDKAGIYFR